ncbi:IS110 family RNA-guided transposase [Snuella sedimenti]|uniref:IS110 family transposase n=1 Tax=Snuella sedimenti TaxID=2798802 RepID=A0A8J7IGC9_9FLAO|nr:IS110 family transposase [Snuella sedimenti]MBJ6367428.1 IS110 family transposase [Snuella sedimenti]
MKELQFTKKEDYSNESIYVGIDVHKKSWGICILTDYYEHKVFSQPPEPLVLMNYLHRNFPKGNYYSAYEAGFCGFWIAHELERLGIRNLVVNPSDIPTTNKEKKQKSDKRDARKIARSLRNKTLKGIYVPNQKILEDRLLVRTRQKLLSDIKRCKCRIKSHLNYFGIKIPKELDKPYWSKAFRLWLTTKLFTGSAQVLIQALLEEMQQIEHQKKVLEKQIVTLASRDYKPIITLLQSIPGIGLLGAITLATEIADIKRFKTQDQLHSFVGLVPNVYASGETERVGRITKRHNAFLRPVLIQCAWRAVKADPRLGLDYINLCKTMKSNKAIVRIAKKLMNRVRFVWKNQQKHSYNL